MKTSASIAELRDVSFSVAERARAILSSISLQVNQGEFIVVVGPNGSGKSSLLKQFNGLFRPSKGNVFIKGKNQVKNPLHKIADLVVTLTQDLSMSTFSELTVYENLTLAELGAKDRGAKKQKRFAKVLNDYNPNLASKLNTSVGSLSGGEKQALALCMAMLRNPQLLLLDEHTSALDPTADVHIMSLTSKLIEEKNITALMVTHDISQALKVGTRLIAMNEGQIVLDVSGQQKQQLCEQDLLLSAFMSKQAVVV